MSVAINAPKTPVTKNSNGIAAATIPNVCKMPGPPAPFVPTPLPNIGKSSDSPKGYSTTVTIEGHAVALKGASFGSTGDIASKGTGGGLVSANTHGPTKFIGPGAMDVKFEGKNVQLLGDPMLNNCGPSGSPANSATLAGVVQGPAMALKGGTNPLKIKCKGAPHRKGAKKFTACELKQLCVKCADVNRQAQSGELKRRGATQQDARKRGNSAAAKFRRDSKRAITKLGKKPVEFKNSFTHECARQEWVKDGADPSLSGFSPDHVHEIQLGGHPSSPKNLRWMSSNANEWMGGALKQYKTKKPGKHTGVVPDCCK